MHGTLSHIMTKNNCFFLNSLIFILLLISCKNDNEQKSLTLKKTDIKHKFERQLIFYEYNDNVTHELHYHCIRKKSIVSQIYA